MSGDSDESANSSISKDKKCDFCENIVRKIQKFESCKVSVIHSKCLDAVTVTDRKKWVCFACERFNSSSDSAEGDITVILNDTMKNEPPDELIKENDMLKTYITLLNKIISEMENVNKLQQQ